ncbi:MAG TPA: desulfoferrodoxin [Methanocorpusculum sp.]|nr:desulfoferrodoxin [Methanocorpusculum sp.]
MAKSHKAYKCDACGNIVFVLNAAAPEIECCGAPMTELVPNTVDAAVEKHVPAVEKTADGFKITVGSVTHPMDADHYIQWITFVADDGITYRKFLQPGEAPEMIIKTEAKGGKAYEYCNKHGLWSNQ